MNNFKCLAGATIVTAFMVLPVYPLLGADTDGKWGLGIKGGAYKLGLTDHSDIWTPGWLVNADLKYGITPKFSIGVEGSWMQTSLATLSARTPDGANLSTDNVENGPRQRAYLAGLIAEYHFLEDKSWSPYLSVGSGMYFWKWADSDWNTLSSDDTSLASVNIPTEDKAGNPYELKDQELYVLGGLGVEIFPAQSVSIDLEANFRYLTHLFTSFTDDQDIVGTDAGQLDLPKAIGEVYAGLTFYFGGKKCPPSTCTASANPTSGAAPLTVQFDGSVTGGCPEYTYLWNFGDGGTSAEQSPSHTYETVGDYAASVVITDSKGNTSQNTVSLTAACPPLACTASGTPTSGTIPLMIQFTGSADGGCPAVTYSWDFGDGDTSSEQNPSHTYEKMGTYTAALTATDSKGNTTRQAVSVQATDEFVPTTEKTVVLEGVNFESKQATLLGDAKLILDRVATSLIAHPDVKVEVGGHTDAVGSEAYNLNLSEKRAKAVMDYLTKKGVPAAQLTSKGYGESKPIADNGTPEGKAKNRRVELKRM